MTSPCAATPNALNIGGLSSGFIASTIEAAQ